MNKYHNKKVYADGQVFDSKREYNRYCELLLLQRAGQISRLQRQVAYELIPSQKTPQGTMRAVTYYADFVYQENGKTVVEDVKGVRTDVYKLKKKLMWQVYHILITEI